MSEQSGHLSIHLSEKDADGKDVMTPHTDAAVPPTKTGPKEPAKVGDRPRPNPTPVPPVPYRP